MKISFKNEDKIKTFRHIKTGRVFLPAEEVLEEIRRKMIPDGNIDSRKEIKNPGTVRDFFFVI